jgi:hypothetical protein
MLAVSAAKRDMIPVRATLAQRKIIAELLPALADRLLLDTKNQRTLEISRTELTDIVRKVSGAIRDARGGSRPNSLRLIRDVAHAAIERYELDKSIAASETIYRFRIALMDCYPPIWRQIEVPDGTLDDLHEYIQTAMGWTNSHLHQFSIDDDCYGDPQLLNDGLYEPEIIDSTQIRLGTLFDKARRGTRFRYQYDFGDGWEHEVTFEGRLATEPDAKYPRCIDGARACPPEDVGGTFGYVDFLEAIQDPRHENHKEMLEWSGRRFDPEKFSAATATKEMRRGLPDWRDDR